MENLGWFSFGGWINAVIPILIVPYYSVIGGWVIRYLFGYLTGHGAQLAADGILFRFYFQRSMQQRSALLTFAFFTLFIIYAGVRNGIERVSKFMMPILIVLSVIIAGLFRDQTGSRCWNAVFPGSEHGELFLDDGGGSHGTDVLLSVHCHGYPDHLRFLYEEGRVH